MKESKELVKKSESDTLEETLPSEYISKARQLVRKRYEAEDKLRKKFPSKGYDGVPGSLLNALDSKLRQDIIELRKQFGLD